MAAAIVFYAIILAGIIKEAIAAENYSPYPGYSADYQVQPGLNFNANLYRGGPPYNYAYGAVRNPQKVSQYTLDNYAYDDSPGAGYGPGYWKGQHTYTPKSDSTCSTATTPACSTILTTVTRTLVGSVCVRTTGSTYTIDEGSIVTLHTDTTACDPVAIRIPSDASNTATTTSTSVPCYTTVITQTYSKTKTCTINVQVTSYGDNVGTDANGRPTHGAGDQLLPVTKSASCTVPARSW